jgi:AraC family transcriptional regulator, positive regulator of tynA and feaB
MKKLFSTADVHPRDRFDYWHNVACKNLVDHSSKPECRQTFAAHIEAETLADIGLVLFQNSPMDAVRSARHLARAEGDELFFCSQLSGTVALEQDGRQVQLKTGDLLLLDPLLPYSAKFFSGSKLLVLKIPRRTLEARVGQTREMVAVPIPSSEPEPRWTSSFIAMLPDIAGSLTHAAKEIAKNQTLDMIALSLMKAIGSSSPRVSSARSVALLNVRAAIESRLSDHALDPATVAEATGISARYANALLFEQGTSITHVIRMRRLERCRMALEDPLQSHRTVSDIAYGWGFSDMTHFGRSFKAVYDVSPRDYRKLHNKAP